MLLSLKFKPGLEGKSRTGRGLASDREFITLPRQIATVLQRLADARCLLSVRVADWKEEFASAVLKVGGLGEPFLLDELTPDAGHARVTIGSRLRIRATLSGVTIVFETQVLEISGQGGIAFYRAAFPAAIDYRQRRQHHRVVITADRPVSIEVPGDNGLSHVAELRNISLSGLYAHFREGISRELHRGTVIDSCTIVLPAQRRFRTQVEVAHAHADGEGGSVRMGGRFLNLDRQDRRELQRLVVELDRELARKQIGSRD